MFRIAAASLAVLLIAGCATTPGIEVTRFHLGQPVPRATIAVVAADPATAGSLEFRSHAAAVAAELARIGFDAAPVPASATYAAVLDLRRETATTRRRSPVSIGIGIGGGGGSFGRHGGSFGGGGIGVSGPVGGDRIDATRIDTLQLRIKRRGDEALVWEGRATGVADARGGDSVVMLVRALLADFPGRSGITERYPAR